MAKTEDTISELRSRLAESIDKERWVKLLARAGDAEARADAAESALAAARERERVLVEAMKRIHAEARALRDWGIVQQHVDGGLDGALDRILSDAAPRVSAPTPPAPTVGTCEASEPSGGMWRRCGNALPCPRHPAPTRCRAVDEPGSEDPVYCGHSLPCPMHTTKSGKGGA